MSAFTWDYVSTGSACCPIVSQSTGVAIDHDELNPINPCPGAPKLRITTLDTSETMDVPSIPTMPYIYPIQLATMTDSQKAKLAGIMLTSPIHIHTPTAHIGLIQRGQNGQSVSSRDVVLNIRAFSRRVVDYTVYTQLPGDMKIKLKAAFMQRRGDTSVATTAWERFSTGQPTTNGPIGADLLLGYEEIWGLESVSFGGYSVVHLG